MGCRGHILGDRSVCREKVILNKGCWDRIQLDGLMDGVAAFVSTKSNHIAKSRRTKFSYNKLDTALIATCTQE